MRENTTAKTVPVLDDCDSVVTVPTVAALMGAFSKVGAGVGAGVSIVEASICAFSTIEISRSFKSCLMALATSPLLMESCDGDLQTS
jgi:hypothetical protein